MLGLTLQQILQLLPAILVGLTIHELAHAFIALKLGDDTAKLMGRITLNPLKHVDPVGFLLLLVAGFGWAKPVQIDRSKLKHPSRDDVLIALAGPAANLLLALVLVLALRAVLFLVPFASQRAWHLVVTTFLAFITMNVALGFFNLLPIPPLDGSHLILSLLAARHAQTAALYFRYGSFLLLALILLERLARVDILPIGRMVNSAVGLLLALVGLR